MTEYVTLNFPVVGAVDVPKKYAEVGREDEAYQFVVDQLAQQLKESGTEIPFGLAANIAQERTAASSLVGLAEMGTELVEGTFAEGLFGEDKRKTSPEVDFMAAVLEKTNPWSTIYGQAAGMGKDPIMIPTKVFGLLKLGGTATEAFLQSVLQGTFSGLVEPERKEQGRDLLSNTEEGATMGAILGIPFAIVAKRMGMSPKELTEAIETMSDTEVQKVADEVNTEILRLESPETFDARKIAEDTTAELEATAPAGRIEEIKAEQQAALRAEGIVDEQGVLRPETDGGEEYRALKNQFNSDVNKMFAEAEQKAKDRQTASLAEMRIIANNLPPKGERLALDGRIKNLENDVAKLDTERQNLLKLRKQQTRVQKSAGQKRIDAINATRIEKVKALEDARKTQAEIARREGIASDYARYEQTGELPARIKELEFKDPRVKQNGQPTRDFETPSMLGEVGKLPTKTQAYDGATNRDLIPEQPLPEAVMPQRPAEGVGRVERVIPANKRQATPEEVQAMQQAEVDRMEAPAAPLNGKVKATPTPTIERGKPRNKIIAGVDYALGNMITRMRNISPRTAQRMTEYDYASQSKTGRRLKEAEQFSKLYRDMPKERQSQINAALMSEKFNEAMALMSPEMRKEFMKVRKVLDGLTKEAKDLGIKFPEIKNYYPRHVKEGQLDNLRDALGRDVNSEIEANWAKFAKDNGLKSVDEIEATKKTEIADQTIRGIYQTDDLGKVIFQKERTLEYVDPKLEPFYDDAVDSLLRYVENSTRTLERARFFGRYRDVARMTDGSPEISTESIGKVVQEAIELGEITNSKQVDELVKLLQSRFKGETNVPSKLVGGIRDLGYIDTIGDIISALKQLEDLGQSARKFGIGNTIAAAFGKKDITAVDLGIEHAIAHELQRGRGTAKLLHRVFNMSQFNRIDRLGKETIMNAAYRKHIAEVKTKAGEARFRKKYQDQLGDRMDETIRDLRNGTVTENVKFLAMNNLGELQPYNMSNMPQAYSDMSNWRVVYMLKSFTLKQWDVIRREVVQEAMKGNIDEAAKNMFMISTYMMASGVTATTMTDLILGREVRPEDIPDRALWSLLGVLGMSKYMWDRYVGRGDIADGAVNMLAPPMGTTTLPYRAAAEAFKEEPNWGKFLKDIPVIGTFVYNRYGGGAEKYNERLD
jgi:hypothetical protein